jgi:hypothetical protein
MDKKTVFVKTSEGEEAMRQRTRLVQRNLRNVLIMVDGHATVADLCRRFGDANAAEAALTELQAGGFIAELSDQLDFTTAPPAEAGPQQAEDVPVLTSEVGQSEPAGSSEPPSSDAPLSRPPVVEEIELTAPEYESIAPPPRPVAPPPAVARPGWLDGIRALFARIEKPARRAMAAKKEAKKEADKAYDRGASADIDPEPIRRQQRIDIGWPRLVVLAVGGLAVLAVLTLLLYPYGRHLPDIERNASAMLQDKVKVGEVGFSFLPRPHLVLRNVAVGEGDPYLRIGSVRAVPDSFSLLGDKKVFRELTLAGVAVRADGLGQLAQAVAGTPAVAIERVALSGLGLSAGGAQLGGFSGEMTLAGTGKVEAIELANADGTIKIRLQPQGGIYRIEATGNAWKSPFAPGLTFPWLEVQGELRPDGLELGKIDARAYEGLLAGRVSLGWGGGATLVADLELKRMSAGKLLTALGSDLTAEGDLSARLKISAKADVLAQLPQTLQAGGSFEMGRGAAKGFDLVEAARARGPTRGGETKFEQLTGLVACDRKDCRLDRLRLASGLLTAGGNLGVSNSGTLSGAMRVELKSSATTVRMQLAVGGSAKDPVLTPARGR